ncbi:hypothetical protein HHK36_006156 [Tetracentron sinense]|uniref:Protein kinase domain-containing protein n=1 Tax=Tetracentron sinense TaxID=13715 RepID=A0A834ZNZ0_TETSI|nr:hypothetical protein HHK36_006156 [Tetracentron sinense]
MDKKPTRKRSRRDKLEVGSGLGFLGEKIPATWGENKVSPGKDDDGGGGVYEIGDDLTERYKILSKIGAGTFGCVVECLDRRTRESVAIDPNWVLEKLGPSLSAFRRSNKYCRFRVDLVREFGRQLLESIAYMHDLHLSHTDLKPDNILFSSSEDIMIPNYKKYSQDGMHCLPKSSVIKLIDFGSTDSGSENHCYVITTRPYRAPEVILGAKKPREIAMKNMEKKSTRKRSCSELDGAPDEPEIGPGLGFLGGKIEKSWEDQEQIDGIVGSFGRVLECLDDQTGESVAIKVYRSQYSKAAMTEIDVLQLLAKNETGGSHFVQIQDWFNHCNHICIVLEKLGPSLYAFRKSNKYCRFLVDLVRDFGRQLLESIAYIHDLHIIHTDLKPENILLASYEDIKIPDYKKHSQDGMHCLPKSSAIKLIDFGSTASGSQNHRYLITARHYRAPEVILGIGWSYPSDLWSVGCILTELFSGKTLFRPRESFEHLAIMERVSGPFPVHMIQKSNWNAEKYFKGGVKLNWPGGTISKESITSVNNLNCLRALVPRNANSSKKSLGDLLHGLLKLDPSERLTARQALNLPFFKNPT